MDFRPFLLDTEKIAGGKLRKLKKIYTGRCHHGATCLTTSLLIFIIITISKMKKKQLINEVRELKRIAGLLNEYEEGDEDTNDPDYVQDEKEQEYHRAEEEASKTPIFKRGDVLKTKQVGNEGLSAIVVLKVYPNLETAYEDRPRDRKFQKRAVDDILAGENGPVSKDIEDKPWYLTWSEDPGSAGEGSDLIFLDPQEFLHK